MRFRTFVILACLTLSAAACGQQDSQIEAQKITPRENRVAQDFSTVIGKWERPAFRTTDGKEAFPTVDIQQYWLLVGHEIKEIGHGRGNFSGFPCQPVKGQMNVISLELPQNKKVLVEYYRDGNTISLNCAEKLPAGEQLGKIDISGQWTLAKPPAVKSTRG